MEEKPKGGRRLASVVGGLFVVGASLLWMLFWAYVAAWIATDDSGDISGWLLIAAAFAVAIVCLFVGVFLVIGWFPRRWGWLAVAVLAALPVVPAIAEGLASEAHVTSVTSAAQAAYADSRGGPDDVTASCSWEGDNPETWLCDMQATRVKDVCFVVMTGENVEKVGRIDQCESDDAKVSGSLEHAYRKSRGGSATARFCIREDAGQVESWSCDLQGVSDGYCYAHVVWSEGGSAETRITVCERDIVTAVGDAYAKRRGVAKATATCTRAEDNWVCGIRSQGGDDTCIVTVTRDDPGSAPPKISYCERELADAVDRLAARVYAKRTGIRDVAAECDVTDSDVWTCDMRVGSRRDRCEVTIERRSAGPRVVFWATTCRSGRL